MIQRRFLKDDLLAAMLKIDCRGQGQKREINEETTAVLGSRDDGDLDPGCMLKVEPTGFVRDWMWEVREREDKDDAEIFDLSNQMDGDAIAEMGNDPGRASLQHKIKNSLLDTLRLRCLLEIHVEFSRGQLDL